MEIKQILQKFFRGYVVLERVESKINGEIEVRENILGEKWLLARGITQSGRSIEKSWQKAIKKVFSFQPARAGGFSVKSCLILGTGAGSAAKVIHNFFPEAKITGIEIDPIMIKMGKKYFNLSTVKNLEIKICDAISLVTNHQSLVASFDLILVDLYLGDEVPEKAKSEKFIKGVKKCFSPSGRAIFNRLYYGRKKKEANEFGSRLEKIFSQVKEVHSPSNLFFICQ